MQKYSLLEYIAKNRLRIASVYFYFIFFFLSVKYMSSEVISSLACVPRVNSGASVLYSVLYY